MSKVENCKEGKFKKFEEIKKKIIEKAEGFIKNYDHNKKRKYYLGISIYKVLSENLYDKKYEIIHSLSFFKNSEGQSVIRENDFSGLIFEDITIPSDNQDYVQDEKDFSYLKYFFNDIDLSCKQFFAFGREIQNNVSKENYIFQFIFIYCENEPEVEDRIKGNIQNLFSKLENALNCIPYSDIKIKIKDSKLLENNYIMIFDLKRNEERKKDYLANADAVLTRKLIFDILNIANKYNFKSLNHTGDGFILIYTENEQNLANDLYNFLSDLKKTLNKLDEYLSTLTQEIRNYKVRGIIERCPKLFEFTYFSSYSNKIFYSKYLDEIFDQFKNVLIKENEELEDIPDILFAIENDIEIPEIKKLPELDKNFKFWIA